MTQTAARAASATWGAARAATVTAASAPGVKRVYLALKGIRASLISCSGMLVYLVLKGMNHGRASRIARLHVADTDKLIELLHLAMNTEERGEMEDEVLDAEEVGTFIWRGRRWDPNTTLREMGCHPMMRITWKRYDGSR